MHIYDAIGVKKYINAHDTYTVYGGSRMSPDTQKAMNMAAEWFVDINELQEHLGDRIAKLTNNEAAYITNGASGALLLAACACMTQGDDYRFRHLPDTVGLKNEIIMLRCQRNAYDEAIPAAGARIVEIGDSDETPDYELIGAINEKTAAVFYFESSLTKKGSMPLEQVIAIASEKGIPVVVDAAAQLPPVSNLWKFTQLGAAMAIFSGGKTLCGPQASGLLLGQKHWIDICRKIGAPAHGICRSSKTGREEMVGLYTAVKEYLSKDHDAHIMRLDEIVSRLLSAFDETGAFISRRVNNGPVGQSYPRAFGDITADFRAEEMANLLKRENPGIYIGICPISENTIYVSPLNLTDDEVDIVIQSVKSCVQKLISRGTQQ